MQNSYLHQTLLHSPEATTQLASQLAPLLLPGDTILLDGPIGAGKSHFSRALIQARLAAAGIYEDVPSPTFTLVQTYDDGVAEIWHSDLYRLTSLSDIDELGLWDAFENAICLIEWPDRLGDLAPKNALTLTLLPTDLETQRSARFNATDPKWHSYLQQSGLVGD